MPRKIKETFKIYIPAADIVKAIRNVCDEHDTCDRCPFVSYVTEDGRTICNRCSIRMSLNISDDEIKTIKGGLIDIYG